MKHGIEVKILSHQQWEFTYSTKAQESQNWRVQVWMGPLADDFPSRTAWVFQLLCLFNPWVVIPFFGTKLDVSLGSCGAQTHTIVLGFPKNIRETPTMSLSEDPPIHSSVSVGTLAAVRRKQSNNPSHHHHPFHHDWSLFSQLRGIIPIHPTFQASELLSFAQIFVIFCYNAHDGGYFFIAI